ncbi:MAG: PAS domain S-box protein [Alphaproteobacteria bacterium]|nr:PAS domain S-box protein [Alphaproteobacteria bacterium]
MGDLDHTALHARIAELEAQLAASQRTVDALIRRAERKVGADPTDRFAVMKAMAGLEEAVAARARELERSEAHFRALWDRSPDMLYIIDGDGRILECNPAAEAVAAAEHLDALFEQPAAALRALARDDGGDDELTLTDGRAVLLASAQLDERRQLVVLRDVTLYRLAEAELATTRRLAVLGQLATAIANAINNPLAVILGRVELLELLGEAEPEMVKAHLDVVTDHARRISGIVDSVLSFARPGLSRRELIPVMEVFDAAQRSCGRRLGEVRVDVEVNPKKLKVFGDRVHLEQAMVVLLTHSADAMHRRGRVRLRAWCEGELCVIAVEDRASRSRQLQELLQRSWSPADPPPTGLALSLLVASNIVREHGGQLHLNQAAGRGTVLRIELPRPDVQGGRTGPKRLVVVDPNQDLAEELRGMLAVDQVRVDQADGVEDAITTLAREPTAMILSAVHLSDGTGFELRSAIAQRWPGLERRLALVVGQGQWGYPGVRVLRRPLSRAMVLDRLARLDANAAGS